jgi:hypothetical protein
MRRTLPLIVVAALLVPAFVAADQSLVRFKGGIGVIPVSRAAGTQNADGTFPDVVRNDIFGTPPGGQPWRIDDLRADVRLDGTIKVDGQGLLLAGSNGIGTPAGQQVRARLFCGGVQHNSNLVPLEPNGDFRIDDVLTPIPPDPCTAPVLLIVSSGGNWFAAGIPKLKNED